jgi:NDP-sugar pyrophosphorylase family protein
MVLAAGRGARMLPLSRVLPKPALPLLDEPVAASALRLAASAGAERLVVNTWHLADAMERALADLDLGLEIAISRESELMDTAGGIALARDRGLLGESGPVLIINGDGWLNLNLEPLLERMPRSGDLVSLALLPHLDPLRWSRVIVDRNGTVRHIRKPGQPEPGEASFLYPGVMLVAREALNDLRTRPGAIPEELWRPALESGRLGGVVVSGHWREIGTPSDYLAAVLGRLKDGAAVVHPSAEVHPSASIGAALIGRGARIAENAVVGEAVVAEGATVAARTRVLRSVLLGDLSTAPAEVVVDEFRAVRTGRDIGDRDAHPCFH